MKRILVKQGPSTLTISVPKDWVKRCGLKNGNEVELEEIDTKLLLSSSKKTETKCVEFDFSGINDSMIREIVIAMYKVGLKDIKINNLNEKQIKKIKEIILNCAGLEIIDSSRYSLKILDIGLADEETINKAETQIYWKLLNLLEKVIEKAGSKEQIYNLDTEINRLAFFIQRNLSSRFSSSTETFLRYEKISILEELGDSIRRYNKHSKKTSDEIKILKEITKLIEEFRVFESKKDISLLFELKKKIESVESKIKINEKKPDISKVFIKEIINRIKSLHENLIASNIKFMQLS